MARFQLLADIFPLDFGRLGFGRVEKVSNEQFEMLTALFLEGYARHGFLEQSTEGELFHFECGCLEECT